MHVRALAAGIFITSVLGLAIPDPACEHPILTSPSFSLIAKVTRPGLNQDVNNWVLTGVHSGAGQAVQVLTPDKSGAGLSETAVVYFQNGTMEGTEPADVPNTNSVLVTGTGTEPAGIHVDPNIAPNPGNFITIVYFGDAMPGTYIRYGGPDAVMPYPHLVAHSDMEGQFYTCNLALYDPEQPVQALYWRAATGTTPTDCSEVQLIAQCQGDVSNATLLTEHLQDAACFSDPRSYTLPTAE